MTVSKKAKTAGKADREDVGFDFLDVRSSSVMMLLAFFLNQEKEAGDTARVYLRGLSQLATEQSDWPQTQSCTSSASHLFSRNFSGCASETHPISNLPTYRDGKKVFANLKEFYLTLIIVNQYLPGYFTCISKGLTSFGTNKLKANILLMMRVKYSEN